MSEVQLPFISGVFTLASYLATACSSTVITEKYSQPQVIIDFNPYVSTLDKMNQSRYENADLQIIIAKVAERFSRIYIELTIDDLKTDQMQSTSRSLSPLATANYNKIANTTQHINVWLGVEHNVFNNMSLSIQHMQQIYSVINKTNVEHTGTLTLLMMPQKIFLTNNTEFINEIKRMTYILNLQRGLLVAQPYICDKEVIGIFEPSIIVFRGNTYFQYVHDLEKELDMCKASIKNFKSKIIFGVVHSVPDTGTDNIVNTTKLVSSWEEAIKWSNSSGNVVLFSTAFDLPNKNEIGEKTSGWWRLVENSSYTSVSDYIFEEKFLVSKRIDWEESPKNFQWLQNPMNFHANSTGMFFQENEIDKQPLKDLVLKELVKSNITRILRVNRKNLDQGFNFIYAEIRNTTNISNYATLIRYSEKNVKLNGSESLSLYFSRSDCDKYEQIHGNSKQKLFETFGNTDYKIFVFYYKEKVEIVKLGARRMFQQRVVKLNLCKQMVLQSGNNKTQIGYILLDYPDLSSANQSPWVMQNIVKYYKLMNDWAASQSNVIVFLPGLDRIKAGPSSQKLGWWRIKPTGSEIILMDKQTDALDLSRSTFERTLNSIETSSENILNQNQSSSENTLDKREQSTNQTRTILIVTTTIATVLTVITLSLLCIKRHCRSQDAFSKEELNNFYHGISSNETSDTEDYVRVPYDKGRYEIEESDFSFDRGSIALGMGEFGKVLRGKINRNGNVIDVAIKTTNPETSHMYALKGLLQEIKLLVYMGKHPNITEFIGANTENLKRGKCLIILELCHLGSLQKYLREISTPTNEMVVEYSRDYENIVEGYVNMPIGPNSVQLDNELSDDLYRWSIEICSAMVYLAEKHVVHADLATRNVLLDLRKVAKVCDFGLSRRMYNYTDYVKTNQEPLPWKWMAPESLRFMQFSEKSDVWSFGITLWEIFSLGEVPYQGMSYDVNFAQILERGLRLSKPRYGEHNMFEIMRTCWKINADQRPKFSTLFNLLTTK